MALPSRLEVVVARLGLDAGERVIEVGCGHGVAGTLVLERLEGGCYVGIDRSATMIAAATRRNVDAVAAGRAVFVATSVEDADAVVAGPFDSLFAARVAAVARPDGLAAVHRLLRPGGRLLVALDAPAGDRARATADATAAAARTAGFRAVRRADAPFDGGTVALVTATRP